MINETFPIISVSSSCLFDQQNVTLRPRAAVDEEAHPAGLYPGAGTGIFIVYVHEGLQFGEVVTQADGAKGVFIAHGVSLILGRAPK
jgi:hypothetical protein